MSEKSDTTMEMAESPEVKSLNPNETDEKPSNEKNKSTLNYFLQLLTDSVVTGVPQIVTVGNLLRKVFKILVLGACIGGFIYQAVEFMKLYQTYPSSLEIEVKYSNELPEPSITICNKNPVQRTQFCKAKKEFCEKPTNLSQFCSSYPHYCKENTTIDDLEFLISDSYLKREDVERFAQKPEDFLTECCLAYFPMGDLCRKTYKKIVYKTENNVDQNCYNINFKKFVPDDATNYTFSFQELMLAASKSCLLWSPIALEQTYSVVVNLDPKETCRPGVIPSAQAVVHSFNDIKNPFLKGFAMEEGKIYTVTLRAFEEHLLPAPFSTNCTDNDELEEDYNRESCINQCTIDYFAKICGCMPVFLPFDVGVPFCNDHDSLKYIQSFQGDENEKCFRQCPRLCHSSYFEYDVSVSNFENRLATIDLGEGHIYKNGSEANPFLKEVSKFTGKGTAILKVVYSKKEVTVFTYTPKYEKIEILGYIGGFSGIWLGVSLVAVFDFFETIIVFIWYLVKKSKVKKDYGGR